MRGIDLAYYAGFFDGEGWIGLRENNFGHQQKSTYYFSCQVGSTNEWIIQSLKFAFGGSILLRRQNPKWKDVWVWTVSARKATSFLQLIYPYLKLKKPQADIVLKFQRHKVRSGRGGHSQEYFDIENEAYEIIKRLNKRGKSPNKEVMSHG